MRVCRQCTASTKQCQHKNDEHHNPVKPCLYQLPSYLSKLCFVAVIKIKGMAYDKALCPQLALGTYINFALKPCTHQYWQDGQAALIKICAYVGFDGALVIGWYNNGIEQFGIAGMFSRKVKVRIGTRYFNPVIVRVFNPQRSPERNAFFIELVDFQLPYVLHLYIIIIA